MVDKSFCINVNNGIYKSERIVKQLTMEENQKGQESSQDKGGKKKFHVSLNFKLIFHLGLNIQI